MMVEGLGDEVVTFFSCLVLIFIGAVSWWSSNVRDNHHPHPPVHRTAPTPSNAAEPPPAPTAPDETAPVDETGPEPADPPADEPNLDQDGVNIKLKFLNDSHKEVRACLAEKLGRFKSRHFAPDLAANKRVRFIFNGHVLGGDDRTLSEHGLFHNCVVHCLVSQNASPPPTHSAEGASSGHSEGGTEGVSGETDPEDLDLSHLCYPLLGSVLVMIWWCQMVYPHYFSYASTLSLVSLTVIFLASILNTYLY